MDGMKYFKKIEGTRLFLSPVNPDDAEIYTQWINDLPTSLRLGNAAEVYSLPQERAFLEGIAKEGMNFAIVLKDTEELLGNCSLFSINHIHRRAELGIFIGSQSSRNKGYGTEAIQLLAEYGFKVLNLNNIMLRLFEFNHPARKCYEKAGFRLFGRRSQSYFVNGQYFDELYMELLSNEIKTNFLEEFLPKQNG
ncbi:GNAT family N-acetyltransferase [Paenibacillus pinistramenti]|uniref:GNAT family N-acetyltransferase n=1 Tax=Paenibacillus pinistramenti TaxID=1768003 RepID=UPI001EEF827A|nr:GNAT family protein [Paenibacillus pinistramenti]